MELPVNHFKRAIAQDTQQIGLWCSLPGGYVAELLAGAGYDWLLFDTEHSPSDPLAVLPQLQAVAPYNVSAAVRPASNDAVLIKRILDAGAQTLLIPYVQDAKEARAAVSAIRYPPRGIRGVAGTTRATGFGRISEYARKADDELCLLVQVETAGALANIEAIAAVDGVDGVFVGPGDLAASMGYPGAPNTPDVKEAVEQGIQRIRKAGKPAGILTLDKEFARRCMELGSVFTAVGSDAALLVQAADKLNRIHAL